MSTPQQLREDLARHRARGDRAHRALARARRQARHDLAVIHAERARIALLRRRLAAQHGTITRGQLAARAALHRVGIHEQPAFSNSGPYISQWITQHGGQPGYAWCQYFVDAMLDLAGGPHLMTGYTPDVVQAAANGEHGLRLLWTPSHGGPPPVGAGLLRYFKWPGVSSDVCDHVGIDTGNTTTVEGNTSPGNTGSQNNGGGVYHRNRGPAFVAAVVDWHPRTERTPTR